MRPATELNPVPHTARTVLRHDAKALRSSWRWPGVVAGNESLSAMLLAPGKPFMHLTSAQVPTVCSTPRESRLESHARGEGSGVPCSSWLEGGEVQYLSLDTVSFAA